jgi:hypothetical protein
MNNKTKTKTFNINNIKTKKNHDLWINKYKPECLNQIVGNLTQINKFKDWINNLSSNKNQGIIISGNQGLGKTLTIKIILEELGYIIRIINPNEIKDHRIYDDFNDYYNFTNSIYNKINFSEQKNKKIALIFDETENITLTSEKKYVMDIYKDNNKSKSFPLIFISNNQHSKLLNDLKKGCAEIIFTIPSIPELTELVKKISLMENITWDSEKSKDFLDNEPASFESLDSKSSMLLNNLSETQIINEPGEKVKTFSSARLSEKSKDFLDNEPYQAKLDKLNSSSTMMNEPGEKVKTFSSARLSEKSKDFLDNEPYQAKLDKLDTLSTTKYEPTSFESLENKLIEKLIIFSQNDIRRLINLFQELSYHLIDGRVTNHSINEFINKSREKNIDTGLFDSTKRILNNYLDYDTIIKLYESEKVLLPLMIHENYLKKILNKSNDSWPDIISNIVKVSDSISRGDNIETSIYTDQNWYLQNIHGFYTCINTSFWINKTKSNYKIDSNDIKFSSDLNKTSLKNINRKNIINLSKIINNKSNQEILMLNRICNHLIQENKENELIKILTGYNKDISIKEIELCLKIDKTIEFNILASKDKKRITKQIKN